MFGPVEYQLKNANRTSRCSGETNPHYVGQKNNMAGETCLVIPKSLEILPATEPECAVNEPFLEILA